VPPVEAVSTIDRSYLFVQGPTSVCRSATGRVWRSRDGFVRAVTADRAWADIDVGVEILCVR
jgi:hypothetical protein